MLDGPHFSETSLASATLPAASGKAEERAVADPLPLFSPYFKE